MMVIGNITNFYELPLKIVDWRIALGFGTILFILGMGWAIFDVYRKYVWGSNPNIKIISLKEDFLVQGFSVAWLKIENEEQTNIENCYGRIMALEEIYSRNGIEEKYSIIPSVTDKKTYRLNWKDSEDSDDRCETEIPRNDSKILEIAKTDALRILKFMICKDGLTPSWKWKDEEILCSINIRIDGVFNEKPMKPKFFDGFISAKIEGVGFDDGIMKGKIRVIHLSFEEKREWMKKQSDKKNKKEEVLTKEDFFKALDKAILTIKKPKSHDEGKKKTSG